MSRCPPALWKSGIDVVGDMPWGAHFCHFYETKDDLLVISVRLPEAARPP